MARDLATSQAAAAAAGGQQRQATAATGAAAAPAATPSGQTNVTVSVMDSFVPTIPEASADAIEAEFPHKTLSKIEG